MLPIGILNLLCLTKLPTGAALQANMLGDCAHTAGVWGHPCHQSQVVCQMEIPRASTGLHGPGPVGGMCN